MIEQLRMLPGEDPDKLIARARQRHSPIASWCLFSGGNDSTVVAHRCRDHYDGLCWIDTGTAVPGVREFIGEYAAWIGKPVRIMQAGDAYRTMVLGDGAWWERYATESARRSPGFTIEDMVDRDECAYGQGSGVVRKGLHRGLNLGQIPHGFPSPGAHGRAYTRLKERQIEALVKHCKIGQHRNASVMLLSGVRRAESDRRAKREPLTENGSAKYVNPLIDWTNAAMFRYRRDYALPESPAAALLHRSGECNCGAFANAGEERPMLMSIYPTWWEATIAPLEREAERRGIRWCRWGGYDLDGNRANAESDEKPGLLCTDCPSRLFEEAA